MTPDVKPLGASALRDAVGGRVYAEGDDGYHAARQPWQRLHDPHPAFVVEATGPHDVLAALRFAREHELPFSVQSTGHGAVLPAEGGVLVKTTAMSSVEVDAGRRIARVGAGALWGDVIAAAAPHGLAPLSGTSAGVGVVGYTLGGGNGWLSRAFGYAADSVVSAQVVTASGELVTASAHQNPDLFWAIRGGSGNFGVVTALEFRLHPAASVYAGMPMFPPDRAAEAFAVYREWALDEPDESHAVLQLMRMPDMPQVPEPVRGKRVLMLRAMYLGSADEAERLYAPLREVAGTPLLDGMRATTFADAAAMLPPPPPMISDMRLELFHEIPDEAIAAVVDAEGRVAGIELRHWGGEMARPGADAGPIGHRDVPFSIAVAGMTQDREEAAAVRADLEAVAAKLRPYATGGTALNFLADTSRTADAYTAEDYRRLSQIKAAYDPDNVFAANHNIPPAG
jgi:FAD/FMN-containing dehydrogenase